jgi:endonuclease YncB( thermonuclease family)
MGVATSNTVMVSRDAGGQATVRLVWMSAPDNNDAKLVLQSILASGVRVKLVAPTDTLIQDDNGHLLAFVVINDLSAQEQMIRGGWAVYRRQSGLAPEPWNGRLTDAQRQAEEAQAGIWRTDAAWMTAQSAAPGTAAP